MVELSGWAGLNLLRGELSGWVGVNLLRGELSGWVVNLLRGVLGVWVEMNFDDNVEESNDHCLRKNGQSPVESDHSQKNDRNQRNNHCREDYRHQMNSHSRRIVVFWSDMESKDEHNDVQDNKNLDRIVDHELVSAHREDRHAYLRKYRRI